LQDPISKIPITKKRAGRMTQGEGPEFKPQYFKKKKNPGTKNIIAALKRSPSPAAPGSSGDKGLITQRAGVGRTS
jgi:hypothetical protein